LGKTQALHQARNVGLLKLRVPFSVDYASVNHRLLHIDFSALALKIIGSSEASTHMERWMTCTCSGNLVKFFGCIMYEFTSRVRIASRP
jgi:hypothetical protein